MASTNCASLVLFRDPDGLRDQLSKSIGQRPTLLRFEAFGLLFDRLGQCIHGFIGVHLRIMDDAANAINDRCNPI